MVERCFKAKDVIFTPGDLDDQLYFLLEGTILDVRLTHQDLANMIASTREAVSKVMGEFQREGSIEVQNRKIVLLKKEALAERASGPSGLSIDGQLSI